MSSVDWRNAVRVGRSASLAEALDAGGRRGRVTAFEFSGVGGADTWIGMVRLPSGGLVAAHHHGETELAVYVARGRIEVRWGEQLEFATEALAGDIVYFAPHVPHQELSLDVEPLELLVVRSNCLGIAIPLDLAATERPDRVA